MDHKSTNQLDNIVHTVDHKINPFFTEKVPALPENIREFLAKITPYVTIIGVILGAAGLLALFGLIGVANPMVTMYGSTGATQALSNGVIGMVLLAIQVVLQALAIPALLKKQQTGWNFLFVAGLVGLIYDLVSFNIFNLIISGFITFYLLYQIKPYYRH